MDTGAVEEEPADTPREIPEEFLKPFDWERDETADPERPERLRSSRARGNRAERSDLVPAPVNDLVADASGPQHQATTHSVERRSTHLARGIPHAWASTLRPACR